MTEIFPWGLVDAETESDLPGIAALKTDQAMRAIMDSSRVEGKLLADEAESAYAWALETQFRAAMLELILQGEVLMTFPQDALCPRFWAKNPDLVRDELT